MTNIKEVANLAGVSVSTVSRVLSGKIPVADETRERVLKAVSELNYRPNAIAQGLKGQRIKTIGLIIPNVRSLVFPAAIRGIEDTASKHGYMVVLCNTDEDLETEKIYIDSLRSRLVDGLIFSTARPDHDHIKALYEQGFPLIMLIRNLEEPIDAVVLDNFDGAYQATKYLLEQGLTSVALINGSMEVILYRQRYEGYAKAMEEAGLPLRPELIIHNIYGWEDAYQATVAMLTEGQRPAAIFATNDPKAIGVLRAVKDFGLRVPEDISVVGFDNCDMAPFLDPPLTSVAQPFYDMGVKACERLIKLIEAKRRPKPKIDIFPAKLVIRKSVK